MESPSQFYYPQRETLYSKLTSKGNLALRVVLPGTTVKLSKTFNKLTHIPILYRPLHNLEE